MHMSNFIVVAKDEFGRVLRETRNKEVYLPFHSHFSLLLKNNNWRRAACTVKIDGTDVLGGRELIVGANGFLDLERFLIDGDLKKGNKFKFVPASHGDVADPTSPENGLVEVEFWLESFPTTTWTYDGTGYTYPATPTTSFPRFTADHFTHTNLRSCGMGSGKLTGSSNTSAGNAGSLNYMSTVLGSTQQFASTVIPNSVFQVANVSNVGATVEGASSSQKFTDTYFGTKEYPSTVIKLWLRGAPEAVAVNTVLYCSSCGKKVRHNDTFCSKCGNKL